MHCQYEIESFFGFPLLGAYLIRPLRDTILSSYSPEATTTETQTSTNSLGTSHTNLEGYKRVHARYRCVQRPAQQSTKLVGTDEGHMCRGPGV